MWSPRSEPSTLVLGRPKGLLCFLPRRLVHSVPSRGEALSRFGGEDSGPRNLVPARRKDTRYTGCRGATLPVTTPASSSPLPARAVLGRSAGAPPFPTDLARDTERLRSHRKHSPIPASSLYHALGVYRTLQFTKGLNAISFQPHSSPAV